MPSCRESAQARANSEWWELEAKRIELAHRVEVLEMRLSKVEMARLEHEDVRVDLARTAEVRVSLAEQAEELRRDLAQQEFQLAAQKSDWMKKTRSEAVGRTFDSFHGASGKTYQQVVITRVTDIGVEFRHENGTARLAANELSPEQQDLFALDAGIADEAVKEEREIASAFDSWVDRGVAQAEEREDARQQALLTASNERAEARMQARQSDASTESTSGSPLRAEARPFGNGDSIWYPYYRSYRNRYYYPYGSCHSHYYSVPSPCRVTPAPSIRVPSSSWSFTARSASVVYPTATR